MRLCIAMGFGAWEICSMAKLRLTHGQRAWPLPKVLTIVVQKAIAGDAFRKTPTTRPFVAQLLHEKATENANAFKL
jgi:hypothetical protein